MKPALVMFGLLALTSALQAADDRTTAPKAGEVRRFAREPQDELRQQVLSRLTTRADVDPSVIAALEAQWSGPAPADFDPIEAVARSVALVDDRAAALVRLGSGLTDPWHVPSQAWLHEMSVDPWVRDQLRLYFGRWLARRKMYDAALEMLAGLEPEDVVDPASLLFYQGAAYHHQLRKTAGLRALDRLLNDVSDCPQRFEVVAGLMREDLKKLEDETLDHIARRMDDVHRRLDVGDGGRRTQRIEEGIVDSLDKIIEELEKQQQQQQGGGGGGQSSSPMQDSRIAKQKGPGNTDRKDIGRKSEWGDLPVETREQIKQQLGKDLPAHYYDLIQQYFGNRNAEQKAAQKNVGLEQRNEAGMIACWLMSIVAAAVEFEAVGVDGALIRGELREFTADKIVLRTSGGDRDLPLSQIVRINRPGVLPVALEPLGAWVELSDGSRLLGRAYRTAGGQAMIPQADSLTIAVPTAAIHAVRLKSMSPELVAQWEQIAASPVKADCVVIREDNSLDYLEGVLADVGAESFAFTLDGESLTVKRAKAEGLIYFHARRDPPSSTFCAITDVLGSKLNIASAALAASSSGDAELRLQTAGGVSLTWPLDRLTSIEFPAQYLSGFKPEAIVFTPRVPSAAAVSPTVSQFYRPKFDRASDSGPLRLGGRDYARGVSIRSRTELTFLLPEPFAKFSAVAGIDDRHRPAGNVRLVIRGDDRVLFEQAITGGDVPVPISLDVTGVVRLKILVDYGDASAAGDHLDLCDPRLFK